MTAFSVFTVANEQDHLIRVLKYIDQHHSNLESFLRNVDTAGQRKVLVARDLTYQKNRTKPFFSVILDASKADQEVEIFRIGDDAIHGEGSELLVASWTSPEGKTFAQLERQLNNEVFGAIVEISEGNVTAVIETNTAKAQRRRQQILKSKSEILGDIIELVSPEQDDVVRLEHSGVLVISGGPGTGKTVVGLQRIAYILLRDSVGLLQNKKILVIGPSESYLSYIRDFFPRLGIANVQNRSMARLCFDVIPNRFHSEFESLRIESDSIKITKNSINFLRVVQESVWPKSKSLAVSAVVETGLDKQEFRKIEASEISELLNKYRMLFFAGDVNYSEARERLGQEIQKLLINPDVRMAPVETRTLDAIRRDLLNQWVDRIGRTSQSVRQELLSTLNSPVSGRYLRLMSGVLKEFYKEDIERAIIAVAGNLKLDFNVLRRWLTDNDCRIKSVGDIEEQSEDIESVGVSDLQFIPLSKITDLKANETLAKVKQVVDDLLPRCDLLAVARQVCTGSDTALFARILGERLGEPLSNRLQESARKNRKGRRYLWSDVDLIVVAELAVLLEGDYQTMYRHVMVDESQDLTRSQLRLVAMFAKDAEVSLVGDLNQATQIGFLSSWKEIADEFGARELKLISLSHNYRIPETIYDYARLYLNEEDRINTPSCDLDGGIVNVVEIPNRRFEDQLNELILRLAPSDERIAVISRDVDLTLVKDRWKDKNVVFLEPEESKGLEVDHSVVLKPSTWFRPTGRLRNLMYVVLTRATKSVTILEAALNKSEIIDPEL